MKKYLLESVHKLKMEISEKQLEQFEIFYNLLIEKNKVMNLTAITEEKEVVKKHFIDSISILQYISFNQLSVIDVGTGAGFPGIPLAIMCPDAKFLLLDSLNKRLKFLEEVIHECELFNVSLIHSRAEDGGRNSELREQFDICVSRAVAHLSVLLEYCSPFIKPGGRFISYKSGDIADEIHSSKFAQKLLSCEMSQLIQFDLMGEEISRSFAIFDKKRILSKKYPRQAGKVKREPL